jgi:hypothetical protein
MVRGGLNRPPAPVAAWAIYAPAPADFIDGGSIPMPEIQSGFSVPGKDACSSASNVCRHAQLAAMAVC